MNKIVSEHNLQIDLIKHELRGNSECNKSGCSPLAGVCIVLKISVVVLAPDVSQAHTIPLSLSLLLWTAHPPAIVPIPSLPSLIPDWSTQSAGLLYIRDPVALGSITDVNILTQHKNHDKDYRQMTDPPSR
jgi:hypothetical protein